MLMFGYEKVGVWEWIGVYNMTLIFGGEVMVLGYET